VVVVHADAIAYRKAFGKRAVKPDAIDMSLLVARRLTVPFEGPGWRPVGAVRCIATIFERLAVGDRPWSASKAEGPSQR